MDLNTSMYDGLTGTQLTFCFIVMLVISDISVLLHMKDLLELTHCAYHNYVNSAFGSGWWLRLVAIPSD